MTGRRALRSSSCWTRSLREIGLLEAGSEELLLFLAQEEVSRVRRRNRDSERVPAIVLLSTCIILLEMDRGREE